MPYGRRETEDEREQPAGAAPAAGAGVGGFGLPTAAPRQQGARPKPAGPTAGPTVFTGERERPPERDELLQGLANESANPLKDSETISLSPAERKNQFDYGQALQASDATQTGFLNFDRFAAANQGVSRREAKRVNDMVSAQAKKALDAARAARDAYAKQLQTLDSTGAYDSSGNWAPGSGGAQIAGYEAPSDPTGTFTSYELGPERNTAAQEDYRAQIQSQMEALKAKAENIPGFTDSAEYKEAIKQALQADQMLGALTGGKIDVDGDGEPDDYGLNVLSGGSGFDALLLGQAGRPGFKKTADKFGKSGGLMGAVDRTTARAQDSATRLSNSVNQRYSDYQQALGNFEKKLMDDEDARKAAEAAKKNAPKSFSDLVKYGTDQQFKYTDEEVGQRGATNNARKLAYVKGNKVGGYGHDAWMLAEQKMKPLGLDGQAASQYWDDFRNSLPPELKNWVNGLVAWDGEMGEQNALANTDAEWQFFQELFDAYAKENPPKKG